MNTETNIEEKLITSREVMKLLGYEWGTPGSKQNKATKMRLYGQICAGRIKPVKKIAKNNMYKLEDAIALKKFLIEKSTREIKTWDVKKLMKRMKLTHTTIYRAINTGMLNYSLNKEGKKVFTRCQIDSWVKRRRLKKTRIKPLQAEIIEMKQRGFVRVKDWIAQKEVSPVLIWQWIDRKKFTVFVHPNSRVTYVEPHIIEAYYEERRKANYLKPLKGDTSETP